jgi:hypothetical protein
MEELRLQSAATFRLSCHANDLSARLLLLSIRNDCPANGPDTQFFPDIFCKHFPPHRQDFRPPVLPSERNIDWLLASVSCLEGWFQGQNGHFKVLFAPYV